MVIEIFGFIKSEISLGDIAAIGALISSPLGHENRSKSRLQENLEIEYIQRVER